jgi:hypothetical protein
VNRKPTGVSTTAHSKAAGRGEASKAVGSMGACKALYLCHMSVSTVHMAARHTGVSDSNLEVGKIILLSNFELVTSAKGEKCKNKSEIEKLPVLDPDIEYCNRYWKLYSVSLQISISGLTSLQVNKNPKILKPKFEHK